MSRRELVNPTLAESFEQLRSDYSAAKSSRFRRRRTGVNSLGSGADWHVRNESDYLRMMEDARDMDRNDVVVGQVLDRATTNIIQDGFTLDPQTGDKDVNQHLKGQWEDWAGDPDQCDLAGENTFGITKNSPPAPAFSTAMSASCRINPGGSKPSKRIGCEPREIRR